MEFQEFCKNFIRMCDSLGCSECVIDKMIRSPDNCNSFCINYSEQAEQIVEKWSKDHPIVTNGDKFREFFGFDIAVVSGLLNEEWLNQEYKEPEEKGK